MTPICRNLKPKHYEGNQESNYIIGPNGEKGNPSEISHTL